MNTLTIPGFTAEISLSHHTTSYRMLASGNVNASSSVIPQLPKWLKCAIAIGLEAALCTPGPQAAGCIPAAVAAINACT